MPTTVAPAGGSPSSTQELLSTLLGALDGFLSYRAADHDGVGLLDNDALWEAAEAASRLAHTKLAEGGNP